MRTPSDNEIDVAMSNQERAAATKRWKEPARDSGADFLFDVIEIHRQSMLCAWNRWLKFGQPKPMATVYEEMQSTSNAMRQLHELDIQRRAHERGKAGR